MSNLSTTAIQTLDIYSNAFAYQGNLNNPLTPPSTSELEFGFQPDTIIQSEPVNYLMFNASALQQQLQACGVLVYNKDNAITFEGNTTTTYSVLKGCEFVLYSQLKEGNLTKYTALLNIPTGTTENDILTTTNPNKTLTWAVPSKWLPKAIDIGNVVYTMIPSSKRGAISGNGLSKTYYGYGNNDTGYYLVGGQSIVDLDFPSLSAVLAFSNLSALPTPTANGTLINSTTTIGEATNGNLPETNIETNGTLNLEHDHGTTQSQHIHTFLFERYQQVSSYVANFLNAYEIAYGSLTAPVYGNDRIDVIIPPSDIGGEDISPDETILLNASSIDITVNSALSSSQDVSLTGAFGTGNQNNPAGNYYNCVFYAGFIGQ